MTSTEDPFDGSSESDVALNLDALDASTSSDSEDGQTAVNYRKAALGGDGPALEGRAWKQQNWDITDMYGDGDEDGAKKKNRPPKKGGLRNLNDGTNTQSAVLSGKVGGLMLGEMLASRASVKSLPPQSTGTIQRETDGDSIADDESDSVYAMQAEKNYEGVVNVEGLWDIAVGTTDKEAPTLNQVREFLEDIDRQADGIEAELAKAPSVLRKQYGESLDVDIRKIETLLDDDVNELELSLADALTAKQKEHHSQMEKEIFSKRQDLHTERKRLVEEAIKEAIAHHDQQLQSAVSEARRLEHRIRIDSDVIKHLRQRVTGLTNLMESGPPPPPRPAPPPALSSEEHMSPLSESSATYATSSVRVEPTVPFPQAMPSRFGQLATVAEVNEELFTSQSTLPGTGTTPKAEQVAPDPGPPYLALNRASDQSDLAALDTLARESLTDAAPAGLATTADAGGTGDNGVEEQVDGERDGEAQSTGGKTGGANEIASGVSATTKEADTGLDLKLRKEVDRRTIVQRRLDTVDDVHVYLLQARFETIQDHMELKQAQALLDLRVGHLDDMVVPFERARARYAVLVRNAQEVRQRVERLRGGFLEWQSEATMVSEQQTRQMYEIAHRNQNLLSDLDSNTTRFLSEAELERRKQRAIGSDSSSDSISSGDDVIHGATLTERRLKQRAKHRRAGKQTKAPPGPDWIARTNNAWRLRTQAAYENPLNALSQRNRQVRMQGNTLANAQYGLTEGVMAPYAKEGGERPKKKKKKATASKGVRFAQQDTDLEEYSKERAEKEAAEARERAATERILARMSIKAIWSASQPDPLESTTTEPQPKPPTSGRRRVTLAAAATRANAPRQWDVRTQLPALENVGAKDATDTSRPKKGKTPARPQLPKSEHSGSGRHRHQRGLTTDRKLAIDPLDGQLGGQVGLTRTMAEHGNARFFHPKDKQKDEYELQTEWEKAHGIAHGTDNATGVGGAARAPEAQQQTGVLAGGRVHRQTFGAESNTAPGALPHPGERYAVGVIRDRFGHIIEDGRVKGPSEDTTEAQLRNIAREYLHHVIYGNGDGDDSVTSSSVAASALLQFHSLRAR